MRRMRGAGEVYSLFNVGYQNLELNFGGPIRFTVPIPFPHQARTATKRC
ncbi:MAG: hypothetical protein R2838_07220 [Caldilineaceae bacterium]